MKNSLVFITAILATVLPGYAEIKLNETFVDGSNWEAGQNWKITDDGKMCSTCSTGSILLLKDKTSSCNMVFEVEVTPLAMEEGSPKACGLVIFKDEKDFWALQLMEGTKENGKKHFVELSEMCNGIWQASCNIATPCAAFNADLDWKYGVTYRLKLAITPQGITGAVMDVEGKILTNLSYRFKRNGIKDGRPGLRSRGMTVKFDNAKIVGQ